MKFIAYVLKQINFIIFNKYCIISIGILIVL